MKNAQLILLIGLLCGCVGGTALSTGTAVFNNFCGETSFSVLEEKGSRINSLYSTPGVVLAVRDEITGSMVMLGSSGDYTYDYLPEETATDDFLVFVDTRALENEGNYCDFAVSVNSRTKEFVIINTTKMQALG